MADTKNEFNEVYQDPIAKNIYDGWISGSVANGTYASNEAAFKGLEDAYYYVSQSSEAQETIQTLVDNGFQPRQAFDEVLYCKMSGGTFDELKKSYNIDTTGANTSSQGGNQGSGDTGGNKNSNTNGSGTGAAAENPTGNGTGTEAGSADENPDTTGSDTGAEAGTTESETLKDKPDYVFQKTLDDMTYEEAYASGVGREWYSKYTDGREHSQSYDSYSNSRGYATITSPYANGNYGIDFSGIGDGFSTIEMKEIIGQVQGLYPLLSTVTTSINGIASQFGTLNPDTQSKLSGSVGSGGELQQAGAKNAEVWLDYVKGAETGLHVAVTTAESNDATGVDGGLGVSGTDGGANGSVYDGGATPDDSGSFSNTQAGSGGNDGYSGGSSSDVGDSDFSKGGGSGGGSGNSSTKKKSSSGTTELVSTVFGTLSFAGIVPFYSEIGVSSTIQSKVNGTYDVVGIYCQDGKYYYKIYDKDVKKYYFVEMNSSCILKTDYKNVLKSNETSMMLNQPQLGDEVLAKMTDPKEVYFMNGTTPGQGEVSGITFASVVDPADGKTYYVPLSDSVEVISLDSITSGTSQTTASTGTTTTTQTVG